MKRDNRGMLLRSTVVGLSRMPGLILLRIFELVIAGGWANVFPLMAINRRFRTLVLAVIFPRFKRLHVRARLRRDAVHFDRVWINGAEMPGLRRGVRGLCPEETGAGMQPAVEAFRDNIFRPYRRPSRKFKDFLAYFLAIATRLESVELTQSRDVVLGEQGLHHLFHHLARHISATQTGGCLREIVIRFGVRVSYSTLNRFYLCNGLASLIHSVPTTGLSLTVDSFHPLAVQDILRTAVDQRLPEVRTLTVFRFLYPTREMDWDYLFSRLPNLRELTVVFGWRQLQTLNMANTLLEHLVALIRRSMRGFQYAYGASVGEVARFAIYFEMYIDAGYFDEADFLRTAARFADLGETFRIAKEPGHNYTLFIDRDNVQIRMYCVSRQVLFLECGQYYFRPESAAPPTALTGGV